MYPAIRPVTPFSSNIYSRRTQLIKHITYLRDILQNQKFANEYLYHNQHLIYSIKYYKVELKKLENEIVLHEQRYFPFGA